jgi:hypothetical protein
MAKIFYLGGGPLIRGMLRAVVPEISDDEATATWPAGYSRVQATPTDFDDRLRFLPEPTKSPERPARQVRRNGSALIHWLTRDTRSEPKS